MKKIFVIVSFVILSVSGVSAQVKFDTFITKIYYGMTESDLVKEFGDDMQYYAPDDTTNNKGHNSAKIQHKLSLAENFYTITDSFSDYEIILQISDHDIPFTISLDSLSGTIKTFVFALNPVDYILDTDISEWNYILNADISELNAIFQSLPGNYDEFNNYYYSNCLLNVNANEENSFTPFVVTIALTDHKMTTEEFEKYGIQQVHMQDEFLGIPLFSTYRTVKRKMSDRGNINYSSTRDELFYRNISFAGLHWDGCCFSFNEKQQFIDIMLFKSSSSETIALTNYQDLKSRLQKKYSMDNGFLPLTDDTDWESDKSMSITLGSKYSDVLCCLRVDYMASQESDAYYLSLTYYDSRFVKNHDDDL